jgi:glycine betaine/choline ABC-type transport system substrate-binding protein
MASIACALLTLAVTLPAGLQLEIAGVDIGSKLLSPPKILSDMAKEVLQLDLMMLNISRNKEDHEDAEDLGSNLQSRP